MSYGSASAPTYDPSAPENEYPKALYLSDGGEVVVYSKEQEAEYAGLLREDGIEGTSDDDTVNVAHDSQPVAIPPQNSLSDFLGDDAESASIPPKRGPGRPVGWRKGQ